MAERRTQAERREATREALIAARRGRCSPRGASTRSAARRSSRPPGVTRGALYHHFDGKRGLFAAVFERIEAELVAQLRPLGRARAAIPSTTLLAAVDQFLDLSLETDVQRSP